MHMLNYAISSGLHNSVYSLVSFKLDTYQMGDALSVDSANSQLR